MVNIYAVIFFSDSIFVLNLVKLQGCRCDGPVATGSTGPVISTGWIMFPA